jgi:hypothetical protein
VIGNSVASIGDGAFDSCIGLHGVTIPDSVKRIGGSAFSFCANLTSITLGTSVTNVGDYAFSSCTSLTGAYFRGNAPVPGLSIFYNASNSIVYYLPGTTGWGTAFGGQPAEQLIPPLRMSNIGVRSNQFGFTITGAGNSIVVVETCGTLTNAAWSPVGTNTLTSGSSYFSDPYWTNYPVHFYRLRSP